MAEKDQNQQNQENQEINSSEPSQEELAKEWEQALNQQEENKPEEKGNEEETPADIMDDWSKAFEEEKSSQAVACPELEKMELLADIPVEISVEIGSTEMKLEEILNLHPNSIVELDRYISEPVDIKVNGKLIAKGELYIVEDQYGIKITQIITPEERIKLIEDY
ncbi:flagellar motor switch protein FliN [Desulfurobacterium atlanticum]|uniref:Flagellar motor switch protein FliN n=1 Tax=Desulfurobacterium atlanticum TaxID=240169 RepID=A0A238YIZ4_9BACT|nr:flagellar motor switch protein FliN [Desulfurobacterium atlanticum]SNR71030.1 flagellar motor switch protein FliN/FliY [Desulfurobacterium atlanticum]